LYAKSNFRLNKTLWLAESISISWLIRLWMRPNKKRSSGFRFMTWKNWVPI
jgi:hypothetical protein